MTGSRLNTPTELMTLCGVFRGRCPRLRRSRLSDDNHGLFAKRSARDSPKASFHISSFARLERFRRDGGIRTRAACAPQTNLLDQLTFEHPLRGWKLDLGISEGVAPGYAVVAFQATITALTQAKRLAKRLNKILPEK